MRAKSGFKVQHETAGLNKRKVIFGFYVDSMLLD